MLKGIKIIDFTTYIPGPFATMRLADLGAEIIKVEPPGGDPARNTANGYVFTAHNRGKKSLSLNLKQEEGKKIALQLITAADVVIESFRPGVMDKLGLCYETVKKLNPGIIYCSLTGYGKSEDLAGLGSHDLNYMSVSGALDQLKDERGKPVHPSNTFADYFGGLAASERILAGLVSRGQTGVGSYHCISIADTMAAMMANHLLIVKDTGYKNGVSVLNGTVIAYGIYETKDGRFVSLAALEQKFWENFCTAVGRLDWLSAQYSDAEDTNPFYKELSNLFKSKTLAEWTDFGQKVDCCLSPVLEASELGNSPFFKKKQLISELDQVKMHSDLIRNPVAVPPEKGADTEEVLRDWLNVSDEQLKIWRNEGVI